MTDPCTCQSLPDKLGQLLEHREPHLCKLHDIHQIRERETAKAVRRASEREASVQKIANRITREIADAEHPQPPQREPERTVEEAVEIITGLLDGTRKRDEL